MENLLACAKEPDIEIEYRLEHKEQHAAQPLTARHGAKAHHRIGSPGFPVALRISLSDVSNEQAYLLKKIDHLHQQSLQHAQKSSGKSNEKTF